jgi:hypothetical protein
MIGRTLSSCATAALAALLPAQAPVVTTVIANGTTQSRYDMVILGDGYQAFEQAQFNADVNSFLTALFQNQPYQTFAAYYNVHTVFRASVESGADRPDESPPVFRNTVYNATYNTAAPTAVSTSRTAARRWPTPRWRPPPRAACW